MLFREAKTKGGKWTIPIEQVGAKAFRVVQLKRDSEQAVCLLTTLDDAEACYFSRIGLAAIIDDIHYSEE